MKTTILAAILSVTAFGATASDLTFTSEIEPTCGIEVMDSTGEVMFAKMANAGSDYAKVKVVTNHVN